jgi:hypothetical protein
VSVYHATAQLARPLKAGAGVSARGAETSTPCIARVFVSAPHALTQPRSARREQPVPSIGEQKVPPVLPTSLLKLFVTRERRLEVTGGSALPLFQRFERVLDDEASHVPAHPHALHAAGAEMHAAEHPRVDSFGGSV